MAGDGAPDAAPRSAGTSVMTIGQEGWGTPPPGCATPPLPA